MKAKFLLLSAVGGCTAHFHVKDGDLVQLWIDDNGEDFPTEDTPDGGNKTKLVEWGLFIVEAKTATLKALSAANTNFFNKGHGK